MSSIRRTYFSRVCHTCLSPLKQVVVGEPSPALSNGRRLVGFYPPATLRGVPYTNTTHIILENQL